MELWKDIEGFEGKYQVSSKGRCRNKDGIILKTSPNSRGVPIVRPYKNGKGYSKAVHALVALAFIGPKPPGMEVCHNDGNKLNNDVDNLRYDTRGENVRDRYKHGWIHPNAAKTHCPRGHEYTEANTYIYPNGNRECKTCRRSRA